VLEPPWTSETLVPQSFCTSLNAAGGPRVKHWLPTWRLGGHARRAECVDHSPGNGTNVGVPTAQRRVVSGPHRMMLTGRIPAGAAAPSKGGRSTAPSAATWYARRKRSCGTPPMCALATRHPALWTIRRGGPQASVQ
jgi:hypothetical protein